MYSIYKNNITPVANESFRRKISNASDAKRTDPREELFEKSFQDALLNMEKFIESPETKKQSFVIAAEKLAFAISLKPKRPEPHLCLAWLFFLVKQKDKAEKYLKAAELINPHLEGITELRANISRPDQKILSPSSKTISAPQKQLRTIKKLRSN